MAEVLMAFDALTGDDQGMYRPHAVGRQRADGMWEGWIEFLPVDGSDAILKTGVETTQPEHAHLVYWATGLTPVYLDGALRRARQPALPRVPLEMQPATDAPARPYPSAAVRHAGPWAALDPFDLASRSVGLLRQELGALHRRRLLDIITAYDLNPGGTELGWMSDAQLVHFIVTAVDAQMAAAHPPRSPVKPPLP